MRILRGKAAQSWTIDLESLDRLIFCVVQETRRAPSELTDQQIADEIYLSVLRLQ